MKLTAGKGGPAPRRGGEDPGAGAVREGEHGGGDQAGGGVRQGAGAEHQQEERGGDRKNKKHHDVSLHL